MEWSTFQERIDKTKIKCRVRIEHMNDKRWAKDVFKRKGSKSSLNSEMKQIEI